MPAVLPMLSRRMCLLLVTVGLLAVPLAPPPAPAATRAAMTAAAATPVTGLSVGTWNTDLQPWLPGQDSVIDTIAATDLDVLGLQGVWNDAARQAILADPRVQQRYPYSYTPPAVQELGSCGAFVPISTQEDFIRSIIDAGGDTREVEQPPVALPFNVTLYGLDLALTSNTCFAAIVNTLQAFPADRNPYEAIDKTSDGAGERFAHGGSTGQLILSRTPITDVSVYAPESLLARYATVYATVAGVRIAFADWPRNVLRDVDPIFGPFQGMAQQPEMAADVLAQSPDLLVGTLQSGQGYQQEAYDTLLGAGYGEPAAQPTYCPSPSHDAFAPCVQRQRDLTTLAAGLPLDHVLVRDTLTCAAPTTVGATPPASDHVGLAVACGPPFPATPLLDDFDRADGRIGPPWAGSTGQSSYRISDGELVVGAGGPILWRRPGVFGVAQEASVTLADVGDGAAGVLLKSRFVGATVASGISVTYDPAAASVTVAAMRTRGGGWTTYAAAPVRFDSGDVLGGRVLPDGRVEIYRDGRLVGTVQLDAADQAFFNRRGGRIGITATSGSGRLDTFGGGSVTS